MTDSAKTLIFDTHGILLASEFAALKERVEQLSHSLVAALERAERAERERDKALAALNASSRAR